MQPAAMTAFDLATRTLYDAGARIEIPVGCRKITDLSPQKRDELQAAGFRLFMITFDANPDDAFAVMSALQGLFPATS
jgi:hypothetical protein